MVKTALKGLDGASSVDMKEFKDGKADFIVQGTMQVKPSAVAKAIGKFKLDRTELTATGDVAKDDKGFWLTPSGWKDKIALANRPKKDDKDKPEDLVGKIEGWAKEGKTSIKAEGVLDEDKDGNLTLRLNTASPVEAKKN